MSKRWWIAAAAAAALCAGCATSGSGAGPQALVGKPAPSFTVARLDGGTANVAQFRGHVVLVNLWATWCPPCREEMPDLQRLYGRYRARDLVVLGVDQGESARSVSAFARSLGVRYPILLDGDQRYGRAYGALGMPTTAIVDRNGIVVRGFDGPLTYSQMVAAIKPLLPKS